MAKFKDPTGNGVIYLNQNYHGESTVAIDKQCAIDIAMKANEYFHSVCDGIVELTTSSGNGYISIIPTDMSARVLYVHTNRYLVKKGDTVKARQKLGQIQDIKSCHLHLGMKNKDNSKNPPQIMDYFDRSLNFKTNYADIAKDWFVDGKLNWSLFKDLQYGAVGSSEDPEITELKKQITTLNASIDEYKKTVANQIAQISTLTTQVAGLEKDIKAKEKEITSLKASSIENDTNIAELLEKNETLTIELAEAKKSLTEAITALNEYKNGRFVWIIGFLEKLFPSKK